MPYCFPQWLHLFIFPPTVDEGRLFFFVDSFQSPSATFIPLDHLFRTSSHASWLKQCVLVIVILGPHHHTEGCEGSILPADLLMYKCTGLPRSFLTLSLPCFLFLLLVSCLRESPKCCLNLHFWWLRRLNWFPFSVMKLTSYISLFVENVCEVVCPLLCWKFDFWGVQIK